MTKEEIAFYSIGDEIENAVKSQLFGKPCFKVGGKAFACFFQNEMVFKLNGESHSDALSLDGSQLFDPSGKMRPMKEWVQVPFHYADNWKAFALSAMQYARGS